MPLSTTHLDQKFWSHFAKWTWEKKSVVYKGIHSPLSEINEKEVFALLVKYADRCRKRRNSEGFKFYVDGQKLHEDEVLDLLPKKKDQSLQAYHQRMDEIFEDYCLVCDELLQVNAEKQGHLTEFTNNLYRHIGFPNRFAEMGLYLGNYRKTPFGVHVDGCGVFSFPVVGTKKFRIWTPEFVEKNPTLERAFQYDQYKKHSQLLVARPGDMTYWPSSAWHIAESDGSFSATWSLGVWVDSRHADRVVNILAELIHQKLGSQADLVMTPFTELHKKSGQLLDLPKLYRQTIRSLETISAKELEAQFGKAWLAHISKQGFKTSPPQQTASRLPDKLRLKNPGSPILWKVWGSNLICGFGGYLVETPKSKSLIRLLTALNTGEGCLIKSFLDPKNSRRDLNCLQELVKAGAFQIE